MAHISNLVHFFHLRKWQCFFLITLVSGLVYISLYSSKIIQSYLTNINFFTQFENYNDEHDLACRITKLDSFEPSIIKAIFDNEDPLENFVGCQSNYPILFNSSVEPYPRLIPVRSEVEMWKFTIFGCCYRTIHRDSSKDWPDHSFKLSKECYHVSLKSETKVDSLHEFISIECQHSRPFMKITPENKKPMPPENRTNTIVDMHAFIIKAPVKPKVNNANEKMNVLVLGLDAMARSNFMRSFEESHNYLINTLHALDMEMHNKIGDNSMPNLGSLLTNLPVLDETNLTCEENLAFDNCPFIWQEYARAGYATMFAEDDRRLGLFQYLKNGFYNPPTQYYFRPFNSAADKYIGREKLLFSKMCYGPRLSFQVWLDYLKKHTIWMNKSKTNYFQFTWSSSVTHDFLNAGFLLDHHLLSFLKWLGNSGSLNNTILIVMGDHGARWGPIRSYYQGQLEERLPALYMVLPQWFQKRYKLAHRNIMINRRRLVTVWDLHQTLLDVLHLENITDDILISRQVTLKHSPQNAHGISMFLPIPKGRTCSMAGIPDNYCTCNHHVTPVSTSNKEVQLGAKFAVKTINKKLRSRKIYKCEKLSLSAIKSARKVIFGESKLWQGYQLNFETNPGKGQFEALVVHDEMSLAVKHWSVPGKILRTNLYGNQSWCVDDTIIRLYCYCKKNINRHVNNSYSKLS